MWYTKRCLLGLRNATKIVRIAGLVAKTTQDSSNTKQECNSLTVFGFNYSKIIKKIILTTLFAKNK